MYRQTGATMNLFPAMENPRNMATTPRDLKFMNLFPQQAGFGSLEEAPYKVADYRYALPPMPGSSSTILITCSFYCIGPETFVISLTTDLELCLM